MQSYVRTSSLEYGSDPQQRQTMGMRLRQGADTTTFGVVRVFETSDCFYAYGVEPFESTR
jgi:hypothetical protein